MIPAWVVVVASEVVAAEVAVVCVHEALVADFLKAPSFVEVVGSWVGTQAPRTRS